MTAEPKEIPDFVIPRNCYECGKPLGEKRGKFFCSREHWAEWAKKNYTNNPRMKKQLTIEEMQARLLEMGKKAGKDLADQAGEVMNS
jgi:uncharacterized Zn finger protein (UPF0148 family)